MCHVVRNESADLGTLRAKLRTLEETLAQPVFNRKTHSLNGNHLEAQRHMALLRSAVVDIFGGYKYLTPTE